jgi:hypothetical protein
MKCHSKLQLRADHVLQEAVTVACSCELLLPAPTSCIPLVAAGPTVAVATATVAAVTMKHAPHFICLQLLYGLLLLLLSLKL